VLANPAHTDGENEHLLGAIAVLEETLRRERAAIARLDPAAVEAIAQEKQTLVEKLAAALTGRDGTPVSLTDERLRREIRRLAARLLASAEANRGLLSECIDSMARARGLEPVTTGAYDGRARITQRLRTGGGKRI
jgi:RNase H-fold protein (predicted Holliday junction resolvase)